MSDITKLPVDKKYNEYSDAYADIKQYVHDRCDGLPIVAVIGILELVKDNVKGE